MPSTTRISPALIRFLKMPATRDSSTDLAIQPLPIAFNARSTSEVPFGSKNILVLKPFQPARQTGGLFLFSKTPVAAFALGPMVASYLFAVCSFVGRYQQGISKKFQIWNIL